MHNGHKEHHSGHHGGLGLLALAVILPRWWPLLFLLFLLH